MLSYACIIFFILKKNNIYLRYEIHYIFLCFNAELFFKEDQLGLKMAMTL